MGADKWWDREALGGTDLAPEGGKPIVDIDVLSKVVSSMVSSPSPAIGSRDIDRHVLTIGVDRWLAEPQFGAGPQASADFEPGAMPVETNDESKSRSLLS